VSRNQREIAFPLAKAVPGNLRAVLPTFPVFRTFSHVLQLQFSRFSHFFTPLHIFFGDSHAFLLFFGVRYLQVAKVKNPRETRNNQRIPLLVGQENPKKLNVQELKCFSWLKKQRKLGEISHPLFPENCWKNMNTSHRGEK